MNAPPEEPAPAAPVHDLGVSVLAPSSAHDDSTVPASPLAEVDMQHSCPSPMEPHTSVMELTVDSAGSPDSMGIDSEDGPILQVTIVSSTSASPRF